jgi:hypothetical protein
MGAARSSVRRAGVFLARFADLAADDLASDIRGFDAELSEKSGISKSNRVAGRIKTGVLGFTHGRSVMSA